MVDMEEIIKREISQIHSLEERVVFKDVVEQVFLSLYETNREMYQELEKRVMNDLAFDIGRYRIVTGVVEREYVDQSHHLLAPMREEDLEKRQCSVQEGLEKIAEEGSCLLDTFFIECDYLKILRLLEKGRIGGTVITGRGEYPVDFLVKRNESYIGEVAHLYQVFIRNGIAWQTVNMPYLYKFIDLHLVGMPEGIGKEDKIVGIKPDFGEFASYVRSSYLPVWNIRKLTVGSIGFPVPCEDHKNFEHTVSIREYGNEHIYLVDDGEGLYSVRREENRLMVMGGYPEARKWQIYMIRCGQNRKFERFTFPLMTNLRRDEFLERFSRRQNVRVRTKAELERFVKGYGMEEYVGYEGCELKEGEGEQGETYSMNGFILDEIRERNYKKRLVLKFRGKDRHEFLHRDIMSFLTSEVQLLYGEYMCEGVLI